MSLKQKIITMTNSKNYSRRPEAADLLIRNLDIYRDKDFIAVADYILHLEKENERLNEFILNKGSTPPLIIS